MVRGCHVPGIHPGIAAVMLIAAVFWKQFTPLIANGKVVVASGLLACLATLALGYSAFMGGVPVFAVAAVFTGVGTSFLCLKMGQVYGSVAMRESLTAGAVSLIFAAFLYYMGLGLPQDWRIVFIAVLPVVSAFLFIMPGDDPFPAADEPARQERLGRKSPGRRSYRNLVLASALVALTAGVGKGLSSVTLTGDQFAFTGSTVTFFIVVIAVLIGLTVNRGDIVRSVKRIYSALMLLGVAVLLASCFGLDLSYLSVGKELLWMLFSCLMAYMVFRFDFSPVRAFGIGQAVYFLVSTAGWASGAYIGANMGQSYAGMVVAVLFAFVIVLILTFVFTDADLKFILTWNPSERAQRREFPGFAPDGEIADTRGAGRAPSLQAQAVKMVRRAKTVPARRKRKTAWFRMAPSCRIRCPIALRASTLRTASHRARRKFWSSSRRAVRPTGLPRI